VDVEQSRCVLALEYFLQLWQRGAHVGTPWLIRHGIGAGDEAEEEFGVRVVRDRKLLHRSRDGEVVLDRHFDVRLEVVEDLVF
jgi:hypothetical protein